MREQSTEISKKIFFRHYMIHIYLYSKQISIKSTLVALFSLILSTCNLFGNFQKNICRLKVLQRRKLIDKNAKNHDLSYLVFNAESTEEMEASKNNKKLFKVSRTYLLCKNVFYITLRLRVTAKVKSYSKSLYKDYKT